MLPLCWAGAMLAGCAGGVPMLDSGQSVSMADFSDQDNRERVRADRKAVEDAMVEAGLRLPQPPEPSLEEQEIDDAYDISIRTGETIVVDSLIGQVNGRPIFADEILTPIMDQLNADYARMPWDQFRPYVVQLVSRQLREVIYNELFLSEARAGLSEQQEGGFLAWMNDMRGELIGQRGGISADANRQMLEEEGKTIDEYLKLEEERQLIQVLMNERVQPNVLVSWKDVERAWEMRKAQYNQPSTVTLGRIRLKTEGNEDTIKLLQDELEAGEPFSVVAKQAGMSDEGVWETFKLGEDERIDEIEVADFYKEHLKGLGPGQTSKPFERGSRTIWVSVIEVNRGVTRSLYEPSIQRALYQDVYSRRLSTAQGEFIDGILQDGIYDDLAEMESKVVKIALSRFLARR